VKKKEGKVASGKDIEIQMAREEAIKRYLSSPLFVFFAFFPILVFMPKGACFRSLSCDLLLVLVTS